jgi:hypothetical protein
MADTKEAEKTGKKGKGSEFFKKHKNAILITSAVVGLIVVYLYVKSRNSSASAAGNVVPANVPANTGSNWGGNYGGGQGAAGPAGGQGAAGPEGATGPPGIATTNIVKGPILNPGQTPAVSNTTNQPAIVSNLTRIASPVIAASKKVAPKAAIKPGNINAPAWTKLTYSKKPVVSKIGTQKSVNPQGGNGRIVTLPNYPAPRKAATPKPVASRNVRVAAKPAPKPVVRQAVAPRPVAKNLTQAKVIQAAYAGRK